jgi:hypothetical protein
MPIYYEGKDLSNLEVIKQENSVLFKIYDNNNQNSILIEYPPVLEEEFNHTDFQIFLFENNYLNAENDVFQVYEKDENIRLGWIFPLSNLEGKENDFTDNKFLNKYKFVAFQLLLLAKEKNITLNEIQDDFQLSDIYPDNPIILILSNNNTSKINDFSIDNYIPSFSKLGIIIKMNLKTYYH